ncbi:MAG: sigma-54-dependent Fis family transcriptional regulator [Gemmatimonadota bacterium]|nr:MAG: sigma-54-dependent Fis family transcriptional regulator [Gemmatimonadota bacterium]
MTAKVLITMDDLEAAVRSNAQLEDSGFETVLVSSQDDSTKLLQRTEPDLVLLTGALQEAPATALLALAQDRSISTVGLVEATAPDPQALARRIGLTAWLRKPADPEEVAATTAKLVEQRRLQRRIGILGESPAIREVLVKIEQMAPVVSTVLVEGESGTGKELVAHAIHELSPRHQSPFIAVNCSALPETLLESELFGHEKGSFTGAAERRLGRFELANRGTLFLDEVGEMPLTTQVKLLRVLESRSFFRVGGAESIKTDVRVIAATNRSLKERVSLGEFRDDLFYRLNVLYIYLPPLRERKSDIPILIRHFARDLSNTHARPFPGITAGAMEILVNAHWPGNVRQLRNLIDSMFVLAPGREVKASDIPADIREGGTRLLPMRVPQQTGGVQGNELEFIFRSLVELKLQVEDLRRRVEESPARVEVFDVAKAQPAEFEEIVPVGAEVTAPVEVAAQNEEDVVYRAGMTMADVERAAIEAALRETRGNRRRAAEKLGIGERTLYRKLKDYELD